MSPERLLALAALAIGAAVFIGHLPHAVRVWRTYSGVAQRRQEDVTGRAPEPSQEMSQRIGILATLGFHEIGGTRVVMPLGDGYSRIMAADDAGSYAIVVESGGHPHGLTALYTAWPDGTWIGTFHPSGDRHERPGLELSVISGTLGEAVQAHRSRVESLRPARGRPRPIEQMTDVLALDADYRQRFGGRELRPLIIRTLLLPMSALLLVIAVSLFILLTAP